MKRWRRRGIFLILLVGLVAAGIPASWFVYPDVASLARTPPGKTAFMAYREAQWREAGLNRRIRQHWVPLALISPHLVKAVVIAEDDKFWSHEGFDFEAMQKALEKDLQQRRFKAGGSTISQQLAKNLYLTPSKTPLRKLKEAVLTWRLERALSKRRILELYLNVAEWGDGIFGIEAAARHHYGKGAADLTPREAARLAVVLPSPRRYNPVGDGRYVQARAEAIYRIMVRRGLVIPDYEAVLQGPDAEGERGEAGTPAAAAEGEAPSPSPPDSPAPEAEGPRE